jgi:hypothetical protein
MKQKEESIAEVLRLKSEFDQHLGTFENLRQEYITYIKKKHTTIINKYPFLHDIIDVVSELLSE